MGRIKHKDAQKKTLVIGAMVVKLGEVDGTGDKYKLSGGEGLPFFPS